jgi:hypothetical protein
MGGPRTAFAPRPRHAGAGAMMCAPTPAAMPPVSWPFLHHPAFQSLLLPALLALLGMGVLRAGLGPDRRDAAALGAALALVLAMAWWPGLVWPVSAQAHKLPWIAALGLLVSALPLAFGARFATAALRPWQLAALAWVVALVWLQGVAQPMRWLLGVAAGALVLAVLAASPRAPNAEPTGAAGSAAALGVAAAGLALLALLAGSLLLMQLGLTLAVCAALPGLWAWAWPRSGLRVSAVSLMPLALAALTLAWLNLATGQVAPGAMALVALATTAPWWLAGRPWSARHARWRPLVVALLAALPVVLALAWQLADPPAAAKHGTDDPYYTPRW